MEPDWSTFTRRITVAQPIRAVYEAWAIPSQLERWFLRMAAFSTPAGDEMNPDREVEAGHLYTWRWHGHPDSVEQGGMITEANGLDRFAFTFSNDSLVTVAIGEESARLS